MNAIKILAGVAVVCTLSMLSPGYSSAQDLELWGVWADGSSGNGVVVRGPNGTVVMLDMGGGYTWASHCKALFDSVGISYVDYAVACHYDTDHVGGIDDLVALMGGDPDTGSAPSFGAFYDRGGTKRQDDSDIPAQYYDFVTQTGKRATPSLSGSSDIDLGGGATLRFLSLGATDTTNELYIRGRPSVTTSITENNKSISVLVTYGGFDFYFGSDLEGTGELAVDDVIVTDLGRSVDAMVIDHHGSDTYNISSSEFLGNMDPEVALIQVWNNGFGHPRYNTVTRIQAVVEPQNERIIRLMPGDTGDPTWAPENMSYCHTTQRHVSITTNGSTYTVDTVDRAGGNDLTDPGLVNHATDEGGGGPTATPTETPIGGVPTSTPTATPTSGYFDVVINEVAWGGTAASSGDEWIELYNATGSPVDLTGWTLYEGGGVTPIITLSGSISANGYFLVERTDDNTVSDIAGDTVGTFSGSGLSNSGEHLQLKDDIDVLVDEVNCGTGWFAGSGSPGYYSMERLDPAASGNSASNWAANDGITTNGLDANSNAVNGTARAINSAAPAGPTNTPGPTSTPTATPTPTPAPVTLPVQVFFDDFPTGTLDTIKWPSNSGPAESTTVGDAEPSAAYSLQLDGRTAGGDEIQTQALDLSIYGQATLSYYWERKGAGNSPEPGEDVWVDYWDGTQWVNLGQYPGAGDDMSQYDYAFTFLPAGALHSTFQVRFRNLGTAHATTAFDTWFIDDVEIRAENPPTPSPTPTSTATPLPTSTPTATPVGGAPTPTATSPAPGGGSGTIVFAVIGDFGDAGQAELDVSTLVKGWNPDFIVTLGDNNYPNGAAATIDDNIGQYYSDYIYPYTGSYGSTATTNLFWPSLGNHDWNTPNVQPHLDYFTLPGNERYYDFVQGPVHFFMIDSDPDEPDGTSSGSTQGTWLQNQLAASTEPWNLVIAHHAPYSSDSVHGPEAYMQWPYQAWGATATLSGHAHTYERIIQGGYPYFVNGLGGRSIYSFGTTVSGSQVRYNSDYGAMRIEASPAYISFQFIDRSGTTIDSYALFKDFPLRFNFQPLPSQPSGTYIMDSGSAYGTQGEYGWL